MTDVRDGEPIAVRGVPKSLKAYRHPDGVYLWDAQNNRHAFTGPNAEGLAPALINMGYSHLPWVRRWSLNFTKRLERERRNTMSRNTQARD